MRPLLWSNYKELSKSYVLPDGQKIQALNGVSVDVHQDEILGIVGESGSGKSTVAKLLVGPGRRRWR